MSVWTKPGVEKLEERTLLAAGALDGTFGRAGIAVFDELRGEIEEVYSIVEHAGDKTLIAGSTHDDTDATHFKLARIAHDGSLDTSFGEDALVTLAVAPNGVGRARDITVLPDGDIILAGTWDFSGNPDPADFSTEQVVAVARLDPNGDLDASFGNQGWFTFDLPVGNVFHVFSVASDSSGIFVVGNWWDGSTGRNLFVVKATPEGLLDETFGQGGYAVTASDRYIHSGYVGIEPNGNIVVAGLGQPPHVGPREIVLWRLQADGVGDPSFGNDGVVTHEIHHNGQVRSLAVQDDGYLVSSGWLTSEISRFRRDGSLDTRFGSAGRIVSLSREADTVLLDDLGRIVSVGGTSRSEVSRFNPNGTFDRTFSSVGASARNVSSLSFRSHDAFISSDGSIVAAGTGQNGGNWTAVVLRYQGTDPAPSLVQDPLPFDVTIADTFDGPRTSSEPPFQGRDGKLKFDPDGNLVLWGPTRINDSTGRINRYKPDGKFDFEFGTDGFATAPVGSSNDRHALEPHPDGGMVVVSGPFVTKLDADGARDLSFGNDGTIDVQHRVVDVKVQQDGRILVGYSLFDPSAVFRIARFLPTGEPDGTFGVEGVVEGEVTEGDDSVSEIQIDRKGRVIVLGQARIDRVGDYLTATRYTDAGVLDSSFGDQGTIVIPEMRYPLSLNVERLLMLEEGKMLLTGSRDGRFQVFRINPDGTFDSAFGNDGSVQISFGDSAMPMHLGVHSDGRIVIAGTATSSAFGDMLAMARLHADGTLDASFGVGGRLLVPFAAREQFVIRDLTIDEADRIKLAVIAKKTIGNSFHFEYGPMLWRYVEQGNAQWSCAATPPYHDREKLVHIQMTALNQRGEPIDFVRVGQWFDVKIEALGGGASGTVDVLKDPFSAVEVRPDYQAGGRLTGPLNLVDPTRTAHIAPTDFSGDFDIACKPNELIDSVEIAGPYFPPYLPFDGTTFSMRVTQGHALRLTTADGVKYNWSSLSVPRGQAEFGGLSILVGPSLHNLENRFDVNRDGLMSSFDLLAIINTIQRLSPDGEVPDTLLNAPDVNNDGQVTPNDALRLINAIQRQKWLTRSAEGESPLPVPIDQTRFGARSDTASVAGVVSTDSQRVGKATLIEQRGALPRRIPSTYRRPRMDATDKVFSESLEDLLADTVIPNFGE